jgi:hypothetical protein
MKHPRLDLQDEPATETPVLAAVMVAVSALPEAFIWRNNTGRVRMIDGRWISFGLVGSADIIGAVAGRPVAIETKRPKGGVFSDQQLRFAAAWRRAGGLYLPARSAQEALDGLKP